MKTFQLHFTGRDIAPQTIHARELADVLAAVENALIGIVAAEHPELSKDNVIISLVNIQTGSIGLQFGSSLPEVVNPSFIRLAEAVRDRTFHTLPRSVYDPLNDILKFIRRHRAQADLIIENGSAQTIATITPDVSLPKDAYITGETTIYGEIVRVGGVTPKVEVKTVNGTTLFCPFDRSLAGELGALLYQTAGLQGEARWNASTLELEAFTVHSVTEYQQVPITEAFAALRERAGKYYDDISDVTAYIASLRT